MKTRILNFLVVIFFGGFVSVFNTGCPGITTSSPQKKDTSDSNPPVRTKKVNIPMQPDTASDSMKH